ncbi:MAG: YceI family protein, partial [Deltaproteobacteria bacterium]|nr:YceI family protein [Deltaproteobacteria bacterium]
MRTTIVLAITAILASGCKDPGAEVTAAKVESPADEQPAAGATAATTASLPINPSNSKVEFVGAKVTASHPGGFTDFSGKVDLADPIEQSRIDVTIQTASLYADKE